MLNWTHDPQYCTLHAKGECDETTDCTGFPTVHDRVNHAQAAYEAYSEADGNDFEDFLQDVALLAWSKELSWTRAMLSKSPGVGEILEYKSECELASSGERKPDAEDKAHS